MKDDKIIDVTKELKKAERRKKVEAMKTKVKDWWEDNKAYVVILGPGVLAGGAKLIQTIGRHHNLKLEERQKDLRVYDTSLGHYWELRRKLDNNDWTYINRERDRGASLGDILDRMKVLK